MNDEFRSQLTALALDELPPETRASVSSRLSELPEAQAYLDGTSEFCALLTRSLAGSETASLSDDQRADLARQLAEPGLSVVEAPARRSRGSWASWTMGLGAAAAAVLVGNHLWQEKHGSTVVMAPMVPPPPVTAAGTSEGAFFGGGIPGGGGGLGALSDDAVSTGSGIADVKKELDRGLGYSDLGELDKARDSFNRVLATDPHNSAARQQLERLESREKSYLLASQDHTRAKMLREVDETWETAVPESAAKPAGVDSPLFRLEGAQLDGAEAATAENAPLAAAPGVALAGRARSVEAGDKSVVEAKVDALATAPAPEAAEAPAGPAALAASEPMTAPLIKSEAEGAQGLAKAQSDSSGGAIPSRRGGEALARFSGADGEVSESLSLAGEPADLGKKLNSLSELQAAQGPVDGLADYKEKMIEEARFHRLDIRSAAPASAEAYEEVPENPFLAVAAAPLSTFSIDVDTASYANVRRFLNQGQRPPKAAVRLEEMINYFRYDYPQPVGDAPFSITVDMAECPWQPQHRLARIGLQGKTIAREQRPAANLVFLVDVSGSMDEPNKLPLVRQSLQLLTSQLKGSDHVGIVTYAGQSGVALPSTSLEQKETVARAIEALSAGGSTNGASGIQLAYQQARQNFKKDGVNRVILATDGDFNVGLTSRGDLEQLITSEAKSGVFLSVLGYGMGNLKDATMEMLADKGNGNYGYIDSLSEARKVLGDQLEGTLHTIAKDVKIQIEFNPAQVHHYRLLGYENRLLAKEHFNDDTKDAGEIGAGHTVTALYELVPAGAPPIPATVDPLRYQPVPPVVTAVPAADQPVSREAMTVKLRYKAPQAATSQLIEVPVVDTEKSFAEAPADFKFATSVALTGLLLKDSAHKGTAHWNMVRELARAGKGPDPEGYRGEFLQLVEKAAGVAP